jgi:hypothetical protein
LLTQFTCLFSSNSEKEKVSKKKRFWSGTPDSDFSQIIAEDTVFGTCKFCHCHQAMTVAVSEYLLSRTKNIPTKKGS